MAVDWSLLPVDLVSATIAKKLETLEDFISFSAVCGWWNEASSLIKSEWRAVPLPWLLLAENTKDNPDCVRKIYNPSTDKCYELNLPETFGARCWGSAYGWIAIIHAEFNVQLFNPISKARIQFPSLETFPELIYDDFDENEHGSKDKYIDQCLRNLMSLFVLKVPQGAHHECVVMIQYGYDQLAFARHGDQSWTPILLAEISCLNCLTDVVAINDNVFALYKNGAIKYWNVKEFRSLEPVKPIDYLPAYKLPPGKPQNFDDLNTGRSSIYLAQSSSGLLMVRRFKKEVLNSDNTDYDYDIVYRTTGFEVYILAAEAKTWMEIKDLDGVALFVGANSSMCVSTIQTRLQPSCIYFTDDEPELWWLPKEFSGHDMGVYNMKCNQLRRFYEGDDTRSTRCPPTWFIPQL